MSDQVAFCVLLVPDGIYTDYKRRIRDTSAASSSSAASAPPASTSGKPTLTQKQLLDVVADQPELSVVLLQKFDIVGK